MADHSKNSKWQLFLDNFIIARSTGLNRVIHHPTEKGIVIPADKPWETRGVSPMYFMRCEDGSFKAFYNAMWWDCERAQRDLIGELKMDRAHHSFSGMGYAVSADGIHWSKPDLSLMDAPSDIDMETNRPFPSPAGLSKHNNLGVPFNFIYDLYQNGNVKDPAKRYAVRLSGSQKSLCISAPWTAHTGNGFFAAVIPEFLYDPDWKEKLSDSGSGFDPRRKYLHFWDDLNNEWVSFEQGVTGHWIPSREIARFSSKDLIDWKAESVLYPDTEDRHDPWCYDEPMGLTPFYTEGILFGLLSWFHSDRTTSYGGPTFHSSLDQPVTMPYCRKGTNEMRLTISRDGGKNWDRTVSREAWIPHGTEEDSYDRLVITGLPPIQVGDEDWFYLGVTNGDHLNIINNKNQDSYYQDRQQIEQIALYIQKHNRYVSLRANSVREIMITRPFVVDGDTLQINVDSTKGMCRIAIAAAEPIRGYEGKVPMDAPHLRIHSNRPENADFLKGFGFDDCGLIRVDSVEYDVNFKGKISLLNGQEIRLYFEMENADLYGFRII